MAYDYEYPYTDPNRYNSDWLLHKMQELEGRLDGIVEEAVGQTKQYVDSRLSTYQSQIDGLKRDIKTVSDSNAELSREILRQVSRLEELIEEAENNAQSLFIISNNRTDLQIERNNEYIFKEIEDNILANITVINYFTGENVTVQSMFDYLASLHLDNSITYNALAEKELSYDALIAKQISYTNLVKDGSILL